MAPGTVDHDESLLTIVTVRSDGYIEDLFVDKTGQHVEAGEPLFRFYSPQIQLAQVDLLVVAMRAQGRLGLEQGHRRRDAEAAEPGCARGPHR